MKNELSDKQLASAAIERARAIMAANQIASSDYTIKIGDYRNSVGVNLSPKSQVELMFKDAVRAMVCDDSFDAAVEELHAYLRSLGSKLEL